MGSRPSKPLVTPTFFSSVDRQPLLPMSLASYIYGSGVHSTLTSPNIGILDNHWYPNGHGQILPVSHIRFLVRLTSELLHLGSFYSQGNAREECRRKAAGRDHPDGCFFRRPVVDISLPKAENTLPRTASTQTTRGPLRRRFVEGHPLWPAALEREPEDPKYRSEALEGDGEDNYIQGNDFPGNWRTIIVGKADRAPPLTFAAFQGGREY